MIRSHAEAATLLAEELHAPRFDDPAYLPWLYDENPVGPAVVGDLDDEAGTRIAHYACVPQRWQRAGEHVTLGITLDAVVRADQQRSGRFRAVARTVMEEAAAEGVAGTVTVANARSTPVFLRHLGFRMVRPLPVVWVVPRRTRGEVESAPLDERSRPDPRLGRLAAELADLEAGTGWEQQWSEATLRWRLASPVTRYTLHLTRALAGISVAQRVAGVPVAILCKLWARTAARDLDGSALAAAACRAHRAPACLYAGWNSRVRVRGLPLPRRLLPSPLNLLTRGFGAPGTGTDAAEAGVATYEFLDADHY